MNEKLGARPWLARTQYEYARMMLARGRSSDHSRAQGLLAQAHDAARALGMPALAEQVAALTGKA